jgi:hypothetical protein
MDFKLVATVNAALAGAAGSAAMGAAGGALGGLTGAALGGGRNCKSGGIKVPLQVHGTTSNPQFVPDVGGAAASMLKSELACGAGGAGNVQGLAKGLTGTGTGGATSTINQLGGLLGGKKKQ